MADEAAGEPVDEETIRALAMGVVPPSGPYDVDAILAELSRLPFAAWPVQRIIDCPQPKVYNGARQIFAMRILPYLRRMMDVLDAYDILFEMPRLDFVIDTMDNEMATIIDAMGLETQTTNVLLGYCAGAKKLKRAFIEGPTGGTGRKGHDAGPGGIGQDPGGRAQPPRVPDDTPSPRSAHPLSHERMRLP